MTDEQIVEMAAEGKGALFIVQAVINSSPGSSIAWARDRIIRALIRKEEGKLVEPTTTVQDPEDSSLGEDRRAEYTV